MSRKRFVKLMRAVAAKCHAINKAYGTVSYKPGKCNLRHYKLPEGMSYAEAWENVANCLCGIVEVGR